MKNVNSQFSMTPHTVPRFDIKRHQTKYCTIEGCGKFTRAGKTFCSNHIEHQPYVQRVLGRIAEREDEMALVIRKGTRGVDVQGVVAKEILDYIRVHGERTTSKMAKEMSIEKDIVMAYITVFKRRRLVRLGKTSRGIIVVKVA